MVGFSDGGKYTGKPSSISLPDPDTRRSRTWATWRLEKAGSNVQFPGPCLDQGQCASSSIEAGMAGKLQAGPGESMEATTALKYSSWKKMAISGMRMGSMVRDNSTCISGRYIHEENRRRFGAPFITLENISMGLPLSNQTSSRHCKSIILWKDGVSKNVPPGLQCSAPNYF